jgi:hypothetical protein
MPSALLIRPVEPADTRAWRRMREALWPDRSADHARAIERYFNGPRTSPLEVLLACLGSGTPVGFIELSINDRVAVVDGCYVEAAHAAHGVSAALQVAAEEWARVSRCSSLHFRDLGTERE